MATKIPKIPGLRGWRKVKAGPGMRPGYTHKMRAFPGLEFFIFPHPNRPSDGPIQSYYITDGIQTVKKGCRTKTDCVKAARRHAREYVKRHNPLDSDEAFAELSHADRAEAASRRIGLPRGKAFAAGIARGTRQTVQRTADSRHYRDAATEAILESGRRPNPRGATDGDGRAITVGDTVTWVEEGRFLETGVIAHMTLTPPIVVLMQDGRKVLASKLSLRQKGAGGSAAIAHRNPMSPYERQLGNEFVAAHHEMAAGAHERGEEDLANFYSGEAGGAQHLLDVDTHLKQKRRARTKTRAAKRRRNPAKRTAAGELTGPMLTMLRTLRRAPKKKDTVTFAQASTLKALLARGLVSELKTKWKINAKGKKATGGKLKRRPNPKPRTAPKRTKKRAAKRKNQPELCKHTLLLERGSKAKLVVCYPRGIFSSLKAAVLNIQQELRAKYGRLKKAPRITGATWKFADAAKTKGRWHFTAKKAA